MNRDAMIAAAREPAARWDVLIVGGGATGLGCAVDTASRGYRTLLVERDDFAKATSSRSTKLVHGGVRYLKQGNLPLVLDALRERGRLLANAPHLVRKQAFVVPGYGRWDRAFYGLGLTAYDLLAGGSAFGRGGFGRSRVVSRNRALELVPTLRRDGLTGGVVYYDGQFDDARLAVNLAQTAADRGAAVLNYVGVIDFVKEGDRIAGVRLRDAETRDEWEAKAAVVINATGVFADEVRRLDDPAAAGMLAPSQGAHIVLNRSFLPGETAVMVPKTDDGRVLFAIPWHGVVLVGTTDVAVSAATPEPRPLAEELAYLLDHAGRYLTRRPDAADVLSTFAGLRPLVSDGKAGATSKLSRDHVIVVSPAGLVTVTGGKWTTYRKMAEDAIDRAATVAGLDRRPCVTADLPVHGHGADDSDAQLGIYGSDAGPLRELIASDPSFAEPLHPRLPVQVGQVAWAVRHESARTVEDVLARRTRCLLLDARAAVEAAPEVAAIMANELGRDDDWRRDQVAAFESVASGYILDA